LRTGVNPGKKNSIELLRYYIESTPGFLFRIAPLNDPLAASISFEDQRFPAHADGDRAFRPRRQVMRTPCSVGIRQTAWPLRRLLTRDDKSRRCPLRQVRRVRKAGTVVGRQQHLSPRRRRPEHLIESLLLQVAGQQYKTAGVAYQQYEASDVFHARGTNGWRMQHVHFDVPEGEPIAGAGDLNR